MDRRDALKSMMLAGGSFLTNPLKAISKVANKIELDTAMEEIEKQVQAAIPTYERSEPWTDREDGRKYMQLKMKADGRSYLQLLEIHFDAIELKAIEEYLKSNAIAGLRNCLYKERGVFEMLKKERGQT